MTNEEIILPNRTWTSEVDRLEHLIRSKDAEIRALKSQIAACEKKIENLKHYIVTLSKEEA